MGELTVHPSWNSGEPTSKEGEERERKPKGMVLLLREGRKGEGLSSLRKKFLAPPLPTSNLLNVLIKLIHS